MDQTPPAAVAFAGTVTRDEFARIQSQLLPVWARWYVLYPVLSVALLAILWPRARLSEVLWTALMVLLPTALTLFARRARITRAWKRMIRLDAHVHGSITPEGIEWNTAHAATRFEWARIERLAQTADLTLAFYSARCAFFFPRSFFASEAEWAAFNRAIAGYVVR